MDETFEVFVPTSAEPKVFSRVLGMVRFSLREKGNPWHLLQRFLLFLWKIKPLCV